MSVFMTLYLYYPVPLPFRVPLCGALSFFFGWIWLRLLPEPEQSITKHYSIGVYSVCLSCVLSACIEPLYLVAQAFLFVKLRVLIETISVLSRTAIFTALVLYRPQAAVLAFSVAQILSLFIYAFSYCFYFLQYLRNRSSNDDKDEEFPFKSLGDFLPKLLEGKPSVDLSLLRLVWSFLKQGFLKQVLTEGERYVMTLFSVLTFSEQGVYDVVNNLGSLAARFIFRPIEESAYFYFSQLVLRDKSIHEQNQKEMLEASKVLQELLRCIMSLGVVVLMFGQSYSRLLLFLYGGSSLAGVSSIGPSLLRCHCFSVFLLGLNGVTEAYALATMNPSQLDRFNRLMAYLSVGFLFVSWSFTRMIGAVGFILANCCNMSVRISHSMVFIKSRYSESAFNPLSGSAPKKLFLSSAVISGIITMISEIRYYDDSKLTHLLIGIICFGCTILSWLYAEKELVSLGYQKLRLSTVKAD